MDKKTLSERDISWRRDAAGDQGRTDGLPFDREEGKGMSVRKKSGKEVSIVRSSAAEYLTFIAASGTGGVDAVIQ